ncbi:MAG: RNA polymerase sigma factor [Ruminiclostridium sp.]|nr:RNA polymerase sigma factor [Ruminiclostridium sp.]
MASDIELMEQVAADDKQAFEELIGRYEHRLTGFIRRFVQDEGACEEIAEDTFVSLWLNRKTYRPTAEFETYLFTIAKRRCFDWLKAHRNDAEILELLDTDKTADSAENEYLCKEFSAQLIVEIEKLREKDGDSFYMFAVQGLPVKAIAKKLGISDVAVRVKVHRTREKLKKLLKKEGLL